MDVLQNLAAEYGTVSVIAAFFVMLLGGFAKGVVGFALPMITISGVGSLLNADWAILSLLLPGLVTNVWQALRSGVISARGQIVEYWRIFLILPVVLAASAQLFTLLSEGLLFILLGGIVVSFAVLELSGFRGSVSGKTPRLEMAAAATAGFSGGLSGVWGPPIMIYLMAKNVQKTAFIQTMGLVFLIGAIVLNLSHVNSGLLNSYSAPFSVLMIFPALIGMWFGNLVQDRLDQSRFTRATLFVLLLAGFNLLRRGVVGA